VEAVFPTRTGFRLPCAMQVVSAFGAAVINRLRKARAVRTVMRADERLRRIETMSRTDELGLLLSRANQGVGCPLPTTTPN
jgi:hypothetical protein